MRLAELRRIAVTGLGVIGPTGSGAAASFARLCAGDSGIVPITHFDTGFSPSKIGGVVQGFALGDYIEDRPSLRNARLLEPAQQWALAAAQQAMTQAGLEQAWMAPEAGPAAPRARHRLGVSLGIGQTGRGQTAEMAQVMQQQYQRLFREWLASGRDADEWFAQSRETMFRRIGGLLMEQTNPASMLGQCPSITTAFIAMRYRAMGPNLTYVSLCAAGAQALGEAAWAIARGDAEVMLAGGADSMLNALDLASFARLDAVSARNDEVAGASKPFDLRRDGCVVGEGAAMLVLESLAHARARGATILAELCGYGTSNDAYKVSAPPEDGQGAVLAMQRALDCAGLSPEQIDHVNAHGTSTPLNDRIETGAIKRVLGAHARKIPVVSTKSMTGHLIAAAGAFEATVSVQSLLEQRVPPTLNLQVPDPRCDLDYVPGQSRDMPHLRTVLSNSFAIGGVNATLIFQAWSEA